MWYRLEKESSPNMILDNEESNSCEISSQDAYDEHLETQDDDKQSDCEK